MLYVLAIRKHYYCVSSANSCVVIQCGGNVTQEEDSFYVGYIENTLIWKQWLQDLHFLHFARNDSSTVD